MALGRSWAARGQLVGSSWAARGQLVGTLNCLNRHAKQYFPEGDTIVSGRSCGEILGAARPLLGRCGDALGRGPLLGRSWALLGRSWAALVRSTLASLLRHSCDALGQRLGGLECSLV